ncbi:MAG: hypothetical protein ABSE52_09310 [Candidatus Dormibacteria bacterium]|jgi:hypothetical protein
MRRRLVAAIVLVCLCLAGWVACGFLPPPSVFFVDDLDGPNVVVTPWSHGPATSVECGSGAPIDTRSAPRQPWTVTVTSAATGKVLKQDSFVFGDVEVLVRSGGWVFIGAPAPSGGPPPPPGFECPGSS